MTSEESSFALEINKDTTPRVGGLLDLQILSRGEAWKRLAYFDFAKDRIGTLGHNISGSVLKNAIAYVVDPSRHQDLPITRNTEEKYKKIWSETLGGDASFLKLVEDAFIAYAQGDDSLFKSLIQNRGEWVLVEIGRYMPIRFGQTIPLEWRARKFHNPMYLTPSGIIQAFPEKDDDSFIDYEMANLAVERYQEEVSKEGAFRIISLKQGRQIHPGAYRRWVQEVKSVERYQEPRRDLRDSYDIYLGGGVEALRRLYSPGYVFMLIRKFKQEGWVTKPTSSTILS